MQFLQCQEWPDHTLMLWNVGALDWQSEVGEDGFLIFYAIFLFGIAVKVGWSFVVNSDCSHFRGFLFWSRHSSFLCLKSPCE